MTGRPRRKSLVVGHSFSTRAIGLTADAVLLGRQLYPLNGR
jgi:hypothetical protein